MGEEKRVLVVDDDVSIRRLLCTLVRREKLPVDSAADGVEAIEKLAQHEYAVILLDLMMPRMDGFGVIDYLRAYPRKTKPVILMISAYADQTFRKVDSEIVAGVIRKPFEVSEIGMIVRLCARGREDEENIRRVLHSTRDRAVHDFLTKSRLTAADTPPGNDDENDRIH